MRQLFFKLLPFAFGAIVALLYWLPLPPSLVAWRPLVGLLLMAFGLLVTVAIQMAIGLPENPKVEPAADESLPLEALFLITQLQELGFVPVHPPLRVYLRPAALLWPFINSDLQLTAAVYSTGTIPVRTTFEIVSVIEQDRGTLTSLADPNAAVLPTSPGHFKQVLRGASPRQLLEYHLEAQRYLSSRGIVFAKQPVGTPTERLLRASQRLKARVRARPLRSVVVTLWRVLSKRSPFALPVSRQHTTEINLAHLRTGIQTVVA